LVFGSFPAQNERSIFTKTNRQRQKAAFGRFPVTGLTAGCRFALQSAELYFAQECLAKTRFGFVASNEPDVPRTSPSGASTIPRIWRRSINVQEIPVKGKTQDLAD
jgi:hypothetical protein